ncbi:hypothetical protein [Novacetimonas hansenii]|uniref:hypothetical protein n=1 Tax=Novacetimonas hansenii TaxID=436 RepID=UPI000A6ECE17|nr:hypothetical protein [Novacetimonas hansenii]
MKIFPHYFPLRRVGISCFYRVTRNRENEGQKNADPEPEHPACQFRSCHVVADDGFFAALMIATLVSDRVA